MRTRNHVLILLTCLAFGSLLCGCGGKDNAATTPAATDSPTAGKMSQDGGKSGATGAPSLSNPGGMNGKDK